MRIIIDHQVFDQYFGGISRYYTEVYRLLRKKRGVKIIFPIIASHNYYLHYYKLHLNYFPLFQIFRAINKVFLHWNLREKNKPLVNFLLKHTKVDVFVPTYYDPYFLPAIGDTPFVLTVYDMIHELFPEYFKDAQETIETKKMMIARANQIIAISENTKQDIIRLYPAIDPHKITVVYLCHSIDPKNLKVVSGLENENYILFVGSRHAYKGFKFFITSIADWLREHSISLYCLGGGSFTKEEDALIDSLNVGQHVVQKMFTEEELGSYYQHAKFFVFPSEYEGFGIPVLEAMASGCPVVLPPVSSFPEVAGEAGVYYELGNGSSLLIAMEKAMRDADYRKIVIERGYKQVKKFSWGKTAEGCLEVYRKSAGVVLV